MVGPNDLISRNEEVLVDARRSYYEEASRGKINQKRLQFGQYLGETFLCNPFFLLLILRKSKICIRREVFFTVGEEKVSK